MCTDRIGENGEGLLDRIEPAGRGRVRVPVRVPAPPGWRQYTAIGIATEAVGTTRSENAPGKRRPHERSADRRAVGRRAVLYLEHRVVAPRRRRRRRRCRRLAGVGVDAAPAGVARTAACDPGWRRCSGDARVIASAT